MNQTHTKLTTSKKGWLLFSILFSSLLLHAQPTLVQYLSGTGFENTVKWDFFCTKGQNSGKWSKIGVPSNWELQEFGTYNYGRDKQFADEQGLYRYNFQIPLDWKNKTTFIVFEGSMTDTEVKINGKSAGPIHQGSFYRFKYNITNLLRPGAKNTLEVTVSKQSSNDRVNRAERRADYWIFGGIFRPVYLEAYPITHISHVAIDAKSNGQFNVNVELTGNVSGQSVECQIQTIDGIPVGLPFAEKADSNRVNIQSQVNIPLLWSPEFPNLYKVVVKLRKGIETEHQISQRFGFRTIEVKQHDGIYVNGQRILFKGVNRHSFWPTSGRCTNKRLSIVDVQLMKNMNMNAVRMSHYPPDEHFLDVCDSLGLFVLDELAGWHASYDTPTGKKLVKEMVDRDVNHPSIILWDNGNEGGFNTELRNEFAKYDPQKRVVIEPWATLNGINTKHYIQYGYGINTYFNGNDIFFPTEFLHGLYDGGQGAGLDDYWNLMLSNPLSGGGFLWVFSDEGVVRTDRHDSIDTDGNNAPDGILGPYREKEGSFFAIKEIWSPVFFEKKIITSEFDGKFRVENRYHYTNLNQCNFQGELVRYEGAFPHLKSQSKKFNIPFPDLSPGMRQWIDLNLPTEWKDYDVLQISCTDPHGRNINNLTWNITDASKMASRTVKLTEDSVSLKEDSTSILLASSQTKVTFSKKTGWITAITYDGTSVPFNQGPKPSGFEMALTDIKCTKNSIFLQFGKMGHIKWVMLPGGWLQLDYDYKPGGKFDFWGLSFSYSEENVTGVTLMANGPYRVWKNRLKGNTFGVYEKKYNNTITGETWDYPEFKGYYSNFYGVTLHTTGLPITIISATENLFLHLFTPANPKNGTEGTTPPFPKGNISFLHSISAMGTKFSTAEPMGPQSQKGIYSPNPNTEPLSGCLYFRFGE